MTEDWYDRLPTWAQFGILLFCSFSICAVILIGVKAATLALEVK